MDTGIGPDSYAIIELKMVEDILKDRDGSRRQLFEEAAGVSKFKIRKKQTLKKLDDTDKDLARVEDLLFEIERNLKSLEKQARQAEKFYELKDQYKQLSISLTKISLKEFNQEIASIQVKGEEETDKRTQLVARIANLEAELEKGKLNILAEEQKLKDAQKVLNEHVQKIRNYESESKIKNERLKYLSENVDRLSAQIKNDKEQIEKNEIFIKSISQEIASIEKQLAEHTCLVDKLKQENTEAKTNLTTTQAKAAELNTKLKSLNEKYFALSKSVEMGQFQLSTLKLELEKAQTDTQIQTSELDSFEEKLIHITEIKERKEAELKKLEEQEKAHLLSIETQQIHIAKLKDEIGDIGRKLDAKQNEYNLTKSLVDNLEGFPEAVRFLKKNAAWVKNAPLLSDILTCDESYRICIENYLEPYMNYYIVEDETDALNAVRLLANSAKGKANFFILNQIKPQIQKLELKQNEVAALDVLEYDAKYQSVLQLLLGNVVIVKTNDDNFVKTQDYDYITLSGNIIKRKNTISGGSVGLFEGKRIGRAKNLEILEKDIKALSSRLETLKDELNKSIIEFEQKKDKTVKDELDKVRIEYGQIQQEYVAYKTRQEQLSAIISKNVNKREEVLDRIQTLQEEIAQNEPLAKQTLEQLDAIKDKVEEVNQELEYATKKASEIAQKYNEQNLILYQLENKLKSLTQELDYRQEQVSELHKRVAQSQQELTKTEADKRALLEKADINDDHLLHLYAEKEIQEKALNEIEKAYYSQRGNVDEIEKLLRETQKQRENTDFILIELNNKSAEVKLKLASIKERLSLEFGIDIEQIDGQNAELPNMSPEELKSKIAQIKQSMERLGQVNPMAMEAYNEMKERYDMIAQQKNDIVEARNSLLATITEIDTTAKTNFLRTFELIKENFKKVFRSLFTEDDSCDLILVDPENPLDSDIDIIARPKGKRPQSINQLSGGEKTLTAISLLFGIYLIKPAPFCIFDEVDAPLDDNNIDKFNNIIKKFSDSSQFIIVTHNKRTMSYTDVIYGVTMIESGVSRVVPVDLRNVD
jgi:chromosome segregation protein